MDKDKLFHGHLGIWEFTSYDLLHENLFNDQPVSKFLCRSITQNLRITINKFSL